jgi:LPXTG-site transpeptidase (sortase) family protein
MSEESRQADETRVPLGIVLIVIGAVILAAVTAVWLLVPASIPRPVYAVINSVLPADMVIPTPAAVAVVPVLPTAEAPSLLPETPTTTEADANLVTLEEALNQGPRSGEPQRILIPEIDLDAPVAEIGVVPVQHGGQTFYQWLVPEAYLAGWHDSSALLGQPGNTVLNGHHNVYGEVFRDLVDLEEGDEIILFDAYTAYHYRVTIKEIMPERDQPLHVRLANAQWIAPSEDERITLVTCWPYTDNSHRLVIVAEPATAVRSSR